MRFYRKIVPLFFLIQKQPRPCYTYLTMTRIARASLIVAVFFALDKMLGFLRQILFARVGGLYGLDVFNTSNNIPDFLSALISGGALGIALIPVLSEFLERDGRRAAWGLFSRIVNLAFIVTAVVSLVIIALASPLVRYIIAPGFDPQKQALTASLMRLDLIAILIFSISGLVMAGLQANQHFLLPALAPAFYNLGQIFGVTILAPQTGLHLGPVTLPAFGMGLHGLVYGVILGATLHLAIQVPGLIHYEFRWAPAIDLKNPGVRQVLTLMGPRVLTMAFLQIYFVARDNLASRFGEGGVAALNLGWFIQQVPETLIGTAIAIALLPSLSEQITRHESEVFRQTINRALRAMLALTLPIAALLAVGARPLIQAAFGFNTAGTDMILWATRAFLLGLMGHAWLEVAVRSFYAQQNARIPLIAASLQAVAFIALAVLLALTIGHVGIALADTFTFTGEALLLLFLLNRRFPGVLGVGNTLLRSCLAAAAGALIVYLLMRILPLPALPLSLGALVIGGLAGLPLIWPEVKMLVKL